MISRRQFVMRSSGTLMAAGTPLAGLTGCSPMQSREHSVDSGVSEKQWQEIAEVQQFLLPSEQHSPGAKDVNAQAYLLWVVTDPDFDEQDRQFIPQGLISLQALSQTLFQRPFNQLNDEEKETALREFEKSTEGYAWITTLLNYLLEALLTDPIYGGNPDQIGWKWLDHTPGFPRPSVKYTQL